MENRRKIDDVLNSINKYDVYNFILNKRNYEIII